MAAPPRRFRSSLEVMRMVSVQAIAGEQNGPGLMKGGYSLHEKLRDSHRDFPG